jgi:hypothetical protein
VPDNGERTTGFEPATLTLASRQGSVSLIQNNEFQLVEVLDDYTASAVFCVVEDSPSHRTIVGAGAPRISQYISLIQAIEQPLTQYAERARKLGRTQVGNALGYGGFVQPRPQAKKFSADKSPHFVIVRYPKPEFITHWLDQIGADPERFFRFESYDAQNFVERYRRNIDGSDPEKFKWPALAMCDAMHTRGTWLVSTVDAQEFSREALIREAHDLVDHVPGVLVPEATAVSRRKAGRVLKRFNNLESRYGSRNVLGDSFYKRAPVRELRSFVSCWDLDSSRIGDWIVGDRNQPPIPSAGGHSTRGSGPMIRAGLEKTLADLTLLAGGQLQLFRSS